MTRGIERNKEISPSLRYGRNDCKIKREMVVVCGGEAAAHHNPIFLLAARVISSAARNPLII